MDTGVRNTLFGIAAFISVILGLLVASIMMPRPMTAEEAQELGFYRFDAPRVISDFDMTDQAGNPVNLEDLKGQWSILFFGFTTCPDICPTTLSVLADAVADIENPPQVVMVSVDPDRDTPEKLGQYVPAFNPAFRGFVAAGKCGFRKSTGCRARNIPRRSYSFPGSDRSRGQVCRIHQVTAQRPEYSEDYSFPVVAHLH
jgi:hypothetical protein